jgi:uncharacterized protein YqeY
MLLEAIKKDYLQERKARNTFAVTIYSTLIGEVEMIGKNQNRSVEDKDVIKSLNKFNENIEMFLNQNISEEKRTELLAEQSIYKKYMPTVTIMSDEELTTILKEIITSLNASVRDVGLVMKSLKEKHEGTFNGKVAAALIKQLLPKE